MKFIANLKKKVTEDWHLCFPNLGIRKPLSLERRVGPLLVGIGLGPKSASGNDRYEAEFSVHNLSRELEFISANLAISAPKIIRCSFHDIQHKKAAAFLREQAALPIEGSVTLRVIIDAYKSFVANHRYPELINQLEDPAMIAAWAGEPELAQQALEWGYETLKTWSEAVQKGRGGVDVWRAKMEQIIADPEKLREITRQEVEKHKLSHLPHDDFPDARYKEKESA